MKKKVRSHLVGAAGVVLVKRIGLNLISTTPSARTAVASRLFIDRAATPPQLRRGFPLSSEPAFHSRSYTALTMGHPKNHDPA